MHPHRGHIALCHILPRLLRITLLLKGRGTLNGASRCSMFSWWICLASMLAAATTSAQSARSVADLLSAAARLTHPETLPFLNEARSELFRLRLLAALKTNSAESSRAFAIRQQYADELLRAGFSERAITQYQELLRQARTGAVGFNGSRGASPLRLNLALAWLRLGEQENCLAEHAPSACIVPFDPSAIHRHPRGAQTAFNLLLEQLADEPSNRSALWLANIAAMTLGRYPNALPSRWFIPLAPWNNSEPSPHFRNIAAEYGVDLRALSGGVIAEDFDRDGDMDLMISSLGLTQPLRFFVNTGHGRFQEQSTNSGLETELGGLNIQQTDITMEDPIST